MRIKRLFTVLLVLCLAAAAALSVDAARADGPKNPASVGLSALVELEGMDLKSDMFSFGLYTLSGSTLQTKNNDADGNVVFGDLTFAEPGTYVYQVQQVLPGSLESGMIYSLEVYTVTVTVTDDGTDHLKAETVIRNDGGNDVKVMSFENTYKAGTISVVFGGKNVVYGFDSCDEPFYFTLYEGAKELRTKSAIGTGDYRFDPIVYEEGGEHNYTVCLSSTNVNTDYVYSDKIFEINVVVTDNMAGTLSAKVTGAKSNGTGLDFESFYVCVNVMCVDAEDGTPLSGGKFQLFDGEGSVVDEWTGTVQAHKSKSLKMDETYTLKEKSAPGGYIIADETTFSIDDTGKVTSSGTTTTDKEGRTVLLVENVKMPEATVVLTGTVNLVGRDLTEDEFTFNVWEGEALVAIGKNTDDGRIVFDTIKYTTDDAGRHVYTVTEDDNGDSTVISDDSEIQVTVEVTTGSTDSLEAKIIEGENSIIFTNTQVNVVKKDLDGSMLSDADLQVLDSEGDVVDSWISDKNVGIHAVEGLEYGKEYTLHEVSAPEGFILSDDITFTVNKDGSIDCDSLDADGSLLMIDVKTLVKVSVTDIADGAELEGATIQVLDKDGNVVEEWVSSDEAHEIKGLKTGVEYTLEETVAPDGYTVASQTKFSLDETGKVTSTGTVTEDGVMLVENAKTGVKVSVTDIADGAELEGATIQVLDKDGKVVEEWVSSDEAHEIKGLK
ncbi:MAG: hypothetical protein IKQ92_13420, partial [Clostridia bacterium]|nr:hypothetical protein [Clostridia bacterium]